MIGKVKGVETKEDGSIAHLKTDEFGDLTADLFIDCTGFGAHLIEKTMGVEFHSLEDILFCNTAVACQIPYTDMSRPIAPFTISTAKNCGWTWEIPLNNRRGVGYVYSNKYTDKDDAERTLRAHIGEVDADLNVRHIGTRIGSRREQWKKNCVSIGLSAGFIEPLESTGIYLTDIALRWLGEFMPPIDQMHLARDQFNNRMNEVFADIVDFIKLHYILSRRTDSDFWIDNQRADTAPDTLNEKLEAWKYRVPGQHEFTNLPKVFGLTNYMQVMYGMDFIPDLAGQESRFSQIQSARLIADRHQGAAQGGIQVLPDHRQLIEQIYQSGFRPPARQ